MQCLLIKTTSILITIGLAGCASQREVVGMRAELKVPIISQSPAAIQLAESEIDMGKTPPEKRQVLGEVRFRNIGSKPLQIAKVTGNCACFSTWFGDKIVSPGAEGKITVVFDKSRMSPGIYWHSVNIETNDPNNRMVKVAFKSDIEVDVGAEISAMRKEIAALRGEMKTLLTEMGIDSSETTSNAASQQPQKKYDIAVGSSPTLGPANAPVSIVEFIDLQCPYCVQEYPKIKEMLQEYPDKIRVVFKHDPLEFHRLAKPAHAAAKLAQLQNGPEAFWKMYEMIMAAPNRLDIGTLRGYAQALNLDLVKFDAVMGDKRQIDGLLTADLAEAAKYDVRGTPTIFINGVQLADRSIGGYKNRIDSVLAETGFKK
jgi:protein-disulfide isomerase